MSSCFCWESTAPGASGYSHIHDGGSQYKCRWKCCLATTCGCLIFLVALFSIIIFAGIVPALAQQSANNSRMIIKSVHISNPTATTIQMDTVLDLVNAGANAATIDGCTLTVSSDNGTIGTMKIPSMHVEANKGATVKTSGNLNVQDIPNFKSSTKLMLSGVDVTWRMKGTTKIHAILPGGMKQTVNVKMDKTLTLPGGEVQNTVSSGFTITHVTSTHLSGKAEITFTKIGMLTMDLENVSFILKDGDVMLGYANLTQMKIGPGFNRMHGGVTTIVRTATNTKSLSRFFSRFLAGNDTNLTMIGPYFANKTVIDGCLIQRVTNQGSTKPHSAIAGFETSSSMNGWIPANGTQLRGGFSNMRNDLTVPLTLKNLSVHLFLAKPIGYSVNVGFGPPAVCNTSNHLSHLFIGAGMNKSDPTQTSLTIGPGEKMSFFAIGEPIVKNKTYPSGNINNFCKQQLGYDCCFSGVVPAAACYNNQQLLKDPNAPLTQDFIHTHLYSNMTVALGGVFEVDLFYYQDFFPVFVSTEVYQGFNLNINGGTIPTPNCSKITAYTT